MKYIFIVISFLILTGCSVKQSISFNTYALENNTETVKYTTTKKTLFINEPYIQGSFATKNIFYSQQPYQYEAYAKNRWVDFPSQMMQRQLSQTLYESQLFSYQSIQASKVMYDYTLNTTVNALYHLYEKNSSYAVVNLTFELIQKGNLIHTLTFNKKLLCEENSPYGYVKAVNQLFIQSQSLLLEELNEVLKP